MSYLQYSQKNLLNKIPPLCCSCVMKVRHIIIVQNFPLDEYSIFFFRPSHKNQGKWDLHPNNCTRTLKTVFGSFVTPRTSFAPFPISPPWASLLHSPTQKNFGAWPCVVVVRTEDAASPLWPPKSPFQELKFSITAFPLSQDSRPPSRCFCLASLPDSSSAFMTL